MVRCKKCGVSQKHRLSRHGKPYKSWSLFTLCGACAREQHPEIYMTKNGKIANINTRRVPVTRFPICHECKVRTSMVSSLVKRIRIKLGTYCPSCGTLYMKKGVSVAM